MIKGCTVHYLGECPAPIWRSLFHFSSQNYREMLEELKSGLTIPDLKVSEDYWLLIWDAFKYTKDVRLESELTQEYLQIFNKNPPEIVPNVLDDNAEVDKSLNILQLQTFSSAESESYVEFFNSLKNDPKPFLIQGPTTKTLAWQTLALSRLNEILVYAEKHKISFWGDNLEYIQEKIIGINDAARTADEWNILLEVLRLRFEENLFFEYGLEYALKEGVSPKEFYPPKNSEREIYFPVKKHKSSKELFSDGVFVLNNQTNFDSFLLRLKTELDANSVAIIDVGALSLLSLNAALELSHIYRSNMQKKILFVNALPLVRMMLTAVGFISTNFKK